MLNDTEENLCFIKLVSGEELISMTSMIEDEDDDLTLVILNHPLEISIIQQKSTGTPKGIKFDHWLKFSDEFVFTLNFDKIITINKVKNGNLQYMYKKFVSKYGCKDLIHGESAESNERKINKDIGMIGTVEETRTKLERIFKSKSVSSI
jgi:hypothetical protein